MAVTSKKKSKTKVRRGRGKGKPGRPIEATPDVLACIVSHLELGNYLETAAELEGVSLTTVRTLLREGARELRRMALDGSDKPEPALERAVLFAQAVRRARAKAEAEDLEAIRRAGRTQWQARAWRLERRRPDHWGRRERHEHSGPGGGAIPFVGAIVPPERLKDLTDEELDAFHRVVQKIGSHRAANPGADRGGTGPQGG